MSNDKSQSTRKFVRFKAEAGTLALIEIKRVEGEKTFSPNLVALVHEESQKGFGAVALSNRLVKPGLKCRVKVGKMRVCEAEVRWRRDLDGDVMRIGFQYLD